MRSMAGNSGRSSAGAAFVLLLLVLVIVGLVYLTQTRESQVGEAMDEVAERSQDAATTLKVKTALGLSKRVSAFAIDVDTQNGVVSLNGEVPSESVKALAEDIASGTSGVVSVDNRLFVDEAAVPNPEMAETIDRVSDLEIRQELRQTLARELAIEDGDIRIEVNEGKVILSGEAESPEEKRRVELLAESIPGVQSVTSSINVADATEETPAAGSDVARRVELALYQSEAIDMQTIRVEARGGVVTLEGSVASEAERMLAERLALDVDGVGSVDNRLEISVARHQPPTL